MNEPKTDCLIFQTSCGQQIPCSAEWVTLELIGSGITHVDEEVVRNASAAVLHYFKYEMKRTFVSVGEFATALEKALQALGMSIFAEPPPAEATEVRVKESDLRSLAGDAGESCELFFFSQLRQELKRQMVESPQIVRFNGLRPCVKQLAGAHRWSRRCDDLSDQIVDYLRSCWQTEDSRESCALVVL